MTKVDSFNLGVAAEFLAASILIELGYEVFLPFDRRGKIDLVAKKGDKFLRIQVKRANWVTPSHTTSRYLRVMTSSHGVRYSKDDIDFFCFVDGDKRAWLVPVEDVENKIILTLDKDVKNERSWSTNQRFKSENYRIA